MQTDVYTFCTHAGTREISFAKATRFQNPARSILSRVASVNQANFYLETIRHVILSIIGGEGERFRGELVSTRDFIRSGRGAREIWQAARIFARETKIAPCAQCRARRVVNNFPKSPAPYIYIYVYIYIYLVKEI